MLVFTARTTVSALAFCCVTAFAAAPAFADSAWDEIKPSVFGAKKIEDGRGVVTLTAPYRPEDMRAVPISIHAGFGDGRTVKTVHFMIDNNPTPVAAVFHMGGARDNVAITSKFRVDRQSDVRAVVESSDGRLYMVEQLVKFAGGQASCSAPPQGDPVEIAANMGKMQLAPVKAADATSVAPNRMQLDLSHPNHTGMVLDQITLLYTPLRMVSEISVTQGNEPVFRMEGSIALAQNPSVDFDFKSNGAEKLEVSAKDTDGGTWARAFPVGPSS